MTESRNSRQRKGCRTENERRPSENGTYCRPSERSIYRRQQRKRQLHRRIALSAAAVAGLFVMITVIAWVRGRADQESSLSFSGEDAVTFAMADDAWRAYEIGDPVKQVEQPVLDVQLLTINENSRPGIETDGVRSVVVHYTANPGSTAQNNRDYFESLKDTGENQVSSNFIVGLDGEIVQCIPTNEIAYASNSRNNDSVSIECCHPDETGKFNDATYDSLVQLVAFLCGKFNLTMDDVIRHYDVTGKDCPRYFVEHEDAWSAFKVDVAKYIAENGQ